MNEGCAAQDLFPLVCPTCQTPLTFIAVPTDPAPFAQILAHIGEPASPPLLHPARGPPQQPEEFARSFLFPSSAPHHQTADHTRTATYLGSLTSSRMAADFEDNGKRILLHLHDGTQIRGKFPYDERTIPGDDADVRATYRFRPIIDLYREAAAQAGHDPETLPVSINTHGHTADHGNDAGNALFPPYARPEMYSGRPEYIPTRP